MKAELNYAVPCLEFCFVSFFGSLSTPVAGTSSVRGERTFLWQIGQSSCAQRAPQVKTLNIGLNFRPEKIKLELVLNAKVFSCHVTCLMHCLSCCPFTAQGWSVIGGMSILFFGLVIRVMSWVLQVGSSECLGFGSLGRHAIILFNMHSFTEAITK